MSSARGAAETALHPAAGAVHTVTSPVRTAWDAARSYDRTRGERDALQARVDELEGARRTEAIASQELAGVLAEQGIAWLGDVPRTTARVTAGATSNFSHSLEIDKGSDAGVTTGMPVVSGAGLVGRIQRVSSDHAVVQLVTDPDFRIGVKVLPGGVLATARGGGDGRPLRVDTTLRADEHLEPGAELVTSGASGSRYPASIPIGVVRGTERAANGLTLDLRVEPFVDTQRTTFVSVLLTADPG